MEVVSGPVLWLILTVIDIYVWIVIIGVILSWLVAFNVINTRNQFVFLVGDFCRRATEPALRPIRNILPNLGGLDISPLALILLLYFTKRVVINIALKMG